MCNLSSYLSCFQEDFIKQGANRSGEILHYLKGLIKSEKKKACCTGIADKLDGHDHQAINHLLSDSFWDPFRVMEKLVQRAWNYLLQAFSFDQIGLLIDETGLKKDGRFSACVARQWLGCLGKQDNGQVFVAATFCAGKFFSIVWMKLFMPQSWTNDKKRRKKCRIPAHELHLPKTAMAREIIEKIHKLLKVKPYWVGFDALYGTCFELLFWLDGVEQRFVAEIKTNTHFYLTCPQPCLPNSKKGRPAKYYRVDQQAISLKAYLAKLSDDHFQFINYRAGTKGYMKANYHRKSVWIWHKDHDHPIPCELLLKKEKHEVKATLISRAEQISTEKLAYMQGQRYFVEQSFKESKNQVGMSDYQIRNWTGTHRHMVCAMLALNFLTEQRLVASKDYEHITIPNLVMLIACLIPERKKRPKDYFEQFEKQHREYEKQIRRNLEKDQESQVWESLINQNE